MRSFLVVLVQLHLVREWLRARHSRSFDVSPPAISKHREILHLRKSASSITEERTFQLQLNKVYTTSSLCSFLPKNPVIILYFSPNLPCPDEMLITYHQHHLLPVATLWHPSHHLGRSSPLHVAVNMLQPPIQPIQRTIFVPYVTPGKMHTSYYLASPFSFEYNLG